MANGDIRTYYEDGQWKPKVDGSSRGAHVGGTRAEHSAVGRDMARERGVEHRITRPTVQSRNRTHMATTLARARAEQTTKGRRGCAAPLS
ncbi:DUF2188 domain-containing protein [Microbacterium sp.]|uniref:DUF2188 domain-containing protein n=1 Tax=Microbacterium sp. TaxID=51671 RepID=UPI0037C84561